MEIVAQGAIAMRMIRPQSLAENIVVVDGSSGSGKSLLAPILSSLARGELWKINDVYERLCVMDHCNLIDRDAAISMVRTAADTDLYDAMIGRNTNFRASDESSAQANCLMDRYQQRLGIKEGDAIVAKIRHTKPLLFLLTHYILGESELLFKAFGKSLVLLIVSVRHPVWLIQNWHDAKWHDRHGLDPRDFQPCIDVDGQVAPWMMYGKENEFVDASPLEKSILAVSAILDRGTRFYEQLAINDKEKIVFVPFEDFARNPRPILQDLTTRMKTTKTSLTTQLLEKMNIPREFPEGFVEKERVRFNQLMKKERVGEEYQAAVDRLCCAYENTYL